MSLTCDIVSNEIIAVETNHNSNQCFQIALSSRNFFILVHKNECFFFNDVTKRFF